MKKNQKESNLKKLKVLRMERLSGIFGGGGLSERRDVPPPPPPGPQADNWAR